MTEMMRGKRVAYLATNGVEEIELAEPWRAVEDAGGRPELVSLDEGEIQTFQHLDKAGTWGVDVTVGRADPSSYDALVLPGGVANGDFVRGDERAVAFVKHFFDERKPVAAICHAPWVLIEAEAVRGRRMTSWPALRTDLRNAGAEWVDEEVVTDGNLITSRSPDDLKAFCAKLIEQIAEVPASR